MSFDICVGAIRPIDRRVVEKAFEALIAEPWEHGWKLWVPGETPYQGFYTGLVYIGDEPALNGFSIERPPGDPEFRDAVFTVLSQTASVVYWPGEPPTACIADADLIPLPPEVVDCVGTPVVVASGAEIVACIHSSGGGARGLCPACHGTVVGGRLTGYKSQ